MEWLDRSTWSLSGIVETLETLEPLLWRAIAYGMEAVYYRLAVEDKSRFELKPEILPRNTI